MRMRVKRLARKHRLAIQQTEKLPPLRPSAEIPPVVEVGLGARARARVPFMGGAWARFEAVGWDEV